MIKNNTYNYYHLFGYKSTYFRFDMILSDRVVEMVDEMEDVVSAITDCEVDDEALALTPREELLVALPPERQYEDGDDTTEAEADAHKGGDVDGVERVVTLAVHGKVITVHFFRFIREIHCTCMSAKMRFFF